MGNGHMEWFNTSKDIGVIFTLTCFLVILITNVVMRGLASVVVILGVVLVVVLALYFNWWDQLATWFNLISIHMNMGFYVCFSTLIFIMWFVTVFIHDRLTYGRVTPGQMTQDFIIGGSAKSYDTRGMVFDKQRKDFFRHWVLGLGSCDLNVSTMGAKRETFTIPNVLFADAKVARIQRLIAMQPDEFAAQPMRTTRGPPPNTALTVRGKARYARWVHPEGRRAALLRRLPFTWGRTHPPRMAAASRRTGRAGSRRRNARGGAADAAVPRFRQRQIGPRRLHQRRPEPARHLGPQTGRARRDSRRLPPHRHLHPWRPVLRTFAARRPAGPPLHRRPQRLPRRPRSRHRVLSGAHRPFPLPEVGQPAPAAGRLPYLRRTGAGPPAARRAAALRRRPRQWPDPRACCRLPVSTPACSAAPANRSCSAM